MTQAAQQPPLDLDAVDHVRMVVQALIVDGQIVPLLGAGVKQALSDRRAYQPPP